MMYITLSSYFHKIYKFTPYFHKIYKFFSISTKFVNLPHISTKFINLFPYFHSIYVFFLIYALTHHALHVLDTPVCSIAFSTITSVKPDGFFQASICLCRTAALRTPDEKRLAWWVLSGRGTNRP